MITVGEKGPFIRISLEPYDSSLFSVASGYIYVLLFDFEIFNYRCYPDITSCNMNNGFDVSTLVDF